jgi:outer membrane beta-barrel protein
MSYRQVCISSSDFFRRGCIDAVTIVFVIGCAFSVSAMAETADTPAPAEQVIQPQLERREIKVPQIRSQDIELGAYTGVLSVEDFGSDTVNGWRLAYHVTEDLFLEGAVGNSSVTDEQFRAFLPGGIFQKPEEPLEYYNVSIGYHFLPGEVFIGARHAMGSGVYILAGIGHVKFADIDAAAFNFGLGVRLLPWDWVALRVEMRDHVFDTDILGKNKTTHNFEWTLGLSVYF